MDKKRMSMIDLQNILGECIEQVMKDGNDRYRKEVFDRAEHIARLAKQMVNNADVILRADKLSHRNDRIDKVVGE